MNPYNQIESFFNSSPLAFMRVVPFNEIFFDARCKSLCKYGCKNFNRKYCCPPDSLKLADTIKKRDYNWALLAATTIPLPEKISVFKKRFLNRKQELEIQKISTGLDIFFTEMQFDHIILSGGACKKCQICSKINNQECKKPQLKLTSMEAVGIDCQKTLSSAGFDFEMPAKNSINRCTAVLFDCDEFTSINWKKNDSNQSFRNVNNEIIESTCIKVKEENPKMFESIELIPISEINQDGRICGDNCKHYGQNFACPPYSNKINLNLWNTCILWEWKKNSTKKSSYNNALRMIHNSFFSLGLYFSFSVRDCFCDECTSCEYGTLDFPICNFRKIMAPSMQSQGIDPSQFGKGKFGLELI